MNERKNFDWKIFDRKRLSNETAAIRARIFVILKQMRKYLCIDCWTCRGGGGGDGGGWMVVFSCENPNWIYAGVHRCIRATTMAHHRAARALHASHLPNFNRANASKATVTAAASRSSYDKNGKHLTDGDAAFSLYFLFHRYRRRRLAQFMWDAISQCAHRWDGVERQSSWSAHEIFAFVHMMEESHLRFIVCRIIIHVRFAICPFYRCDTVPLMCNDIARYIRFPSLHTMQIQFSPLNMWGTGTGTHICNLHAMDDV